MIVSILTRPEGRVQRSPRLNRPSPGRFQSSPVPKDGCNWRKRVLRRLRCTRFNPHPSRRTGATRHRGTDEQGGERFQSSPVPKDGCNQMIRGMVGQLAVSILTRPEGRVQLADVGVVPAGTGSFNPHPSRRTGATAATCA